MMCYKDRTYCNAGILCKTLDCSRRLQQSDIVAARRSNLHIMMLDFTQAECFVPFFSTNISDKPVKRYYEKKKNYAKKTKKRIVGYENKPTGGATETCTKKTGKHAKNIHTGKNSATRAEAIRRAKNYMALKDVGDK